MVTKIAFPRATIHQLIGGEAWPSGMFPLDIIDVVASLGHPGSSLLIDGSAGASSVRFNVTKEIFGRHEPVSMNSPFIPYAEFYDRPISSGLIEIERTDIVVPSGTNFAVEDILIEDFKVVTLASGVRITFH